MYVVHGTGCIPFRLTLRIGRQPTPVFLGLTGGSVRKESTWRLSNWTELNWMPCDAKYLLMRFFAAVCAQLCPITPQTAACQSPLSMGFSQQEYWNGLPSPSPGAYGYLCTLDEVSVQIFCPFLSWNICFLIVPFHKFFEYFGYKSLTRHVFCKYFLLDSGLPFHSLNSDLHRRKV